MSQRLSSRPEALEQRKVVRLYQTVGCQVWTTSQPFRAALSPGIPDLIVFHRRAMWFHETKAPKGKQSPEQLQFQRAADRCGVRYVLGGEAEAKKLLQAMGVLAA